MEIFDQIINEFSTIPHVKDWPEVQALFPAGLLLESWDIGSCPCARARQSAGVPGKPCPLW
jgi:hypothetical protein